MGESLNYCDFDLLYFSLKNLRQNWCAFRNLHTLCMRQSALLRASHPKLRSRTWRYISQSRAPKPWIVDIRKVLVEWVVVREIELETKTNHELFFENHGLIIRDWDRSRHQNEVINVKNRDCAGEGWEPKLKSGGRALPPIAAWSPSWNSQCPIILISDTACSLFIDSTFFTLSCGTSSHQVGFYRLFQLDSWSRLWW